MCTKGTKGTKGVKHNWRASDAKYNWRINNCLVCSLAFSRYVMNGVFWIRMTTSKPIFIFCVRIMMGFFLVNFFCNSTWTFLIKCFSHNKILPWFFVHNTFILFYLGLWFSAIPSYCWHYGGWPRCDSPLCMLI
jgi:hypothetical protein